MGCYDLPGFGDAATFTPAARASLALLDEMAGPVVDDEPTVENRLESVREARGWIELAHTHLSQGNLKRHFECLQDALDILQSLRALES